VDIYHVDYLGQPRAIAPGMQIIETTRVFAGAKTVPVLQAYEKTLGVPRLVDAVDWGFLWFLTKPIFYLVDYFYGLVGNFGIAILMLTVVVRLIMFPLANKSFEMGTKMKKLQPQVAELQKQFKEDPQALQKEMMALYAREKVNPLTGCLPIFLQIPVFYSLTKLFTVTIEMRHAPFFGWIFSDAGGISAVIQNFSVIPSQPWVPGTGLSGFFFQSLYLRCCRSPSSTPIAPSCTMPLLASTCGRPWRCTEP
jgi:YidC/Oxa1 family membrane protein insertase